MMYIERSEELKAIKEIFENKKVCIINGLRGIGKTSIALSYAREQEDYFYIHYADFPATISLEEFLYYSHDNIGESGKRLLIIDDIFISISEFIKTCFYNDLIDSNVFENIILITNETVLDTEIPVLTIKPFSHEQSYEYIRLNSSIELDESQINEIAIISAGHPVIMQLVCSLCAEYKDFDEVLNNLSLYENRKIISEFLEPFVEITSISDSEFETYIKILLFGRIDITSLLRWDSREDHFVLHDIELLIAKGMIYRYCDEVFVDLSLDDIFEEYPLSIDYCNEILKNIKDEIESGKEIEEKYVTRLISALKIHYPFVDFVVMFYESKLNLQENNSMKAFSADLTRLMEKLTHVEETVDTKIVPEVSKISRIDENVDTLLYIQSQANELLNQMMTLSSGNEELLEKIQELKECVENPKQSLLSKVNTCIGFIGSVATLSTFSVDAFNGNMNVILANLQSLIDKMPFIK